MSMSPILRGLLSGLQGFATTYAGQQQKQQDMQAKTAQQQQAQALEDEAWKKREQWKLTNDPPKTMQETVADPNNPGGNLVRNLQWQPPEQGNDPNLEPGQWLVNSTANDPNTQKLAQRSDEAASKAEQAAQRLQQQADLGAQKMDLASQRLALQQERGSKGGAIQQLTDANGNAQLVRIGDDNVAHPIQLESGENATKQEWRQRGGANPRMPKPQPSAMTGADGQAIPILKGNGISPDAPAPGAKNIPPSLDQIPQGEGPASPVFVDPSASRPMSQFSGAKAKPANSAPADGTVLYKNGQKYIVQNGVPVPAQ